MTNTIKILIIYFYTGLIFFNIVFFIIIVGGLTRLTNSGLSITEWELFKGILPPLNQILGNFILINIKKYHNINY